MTEQDRFGRAGPPQPYHDLMGQIEQFRDTGGDGGCFMEVLQGVKTKAALALVFHQQGHLPEPRFSEVMGGLSSLVAGLPPLQTPQALKEARTRLDEIYLFESPSGPDEQPKGFIWFH